MITFQHRAIQFDGYHVGINVLGLEQIKDCGCLDLLSFSINFDLHESSQLGIETGEFMQANKADTQLSRRATSGPVRVSWWLGPRYAIPVVPGLGFSGLLTMLAR